MSSLALQRLLYTFTVVASIATLLALIGCAITPRPSPPPSYALTSGGIGVSVVSPPPTTMPVSVGAASNLATESSGSIGAIFKGWGPFGPGALLLVLPALAYDAMQSAAQSAAQSAQCDAKLSTAFPRPSAILREVVQREFVPQDLEDQFVGEFRKNSIAEVVAVASPIGPGGEAPGTEQLLKIASLRGLAHLLVIEVLSADLVPLNVDCERWAFRIGLRVSLWNIDDGKRVGGPVLTYPYVNAKLTDLRAMMEEPGALRTGLAPNFSAAADGIIEERRFVLQH